LKEEKYDSKILPLCFSYSEKYIPKNIDGERKNEIFWAGKEYHHRTYRTPYLLPLEKMRGAKFVASFTQDEYAKQLLFHKIGLNLRGYGYDTVRYWELPAHATLLFSEKLNIAIENDFTDGETAIFFESPEEMMDKLKFCLQNESYVDTIRMRGHEWFKKYHTSKARAKQMLIKMENMGLVIV
jgi:hypothetical protein